MRIPCIHCGERDRREFTILGDAAGTRPSGDKNTFDAMFDYIYQRTNAAGVTREYWYHGAGCHSWLIVERNNLTHEILGVTDAREAVSERKKGGSR